MRRMASRRWAAYNLSTWKINPFPKQKPNEKQTCIGHSIANVRPEDAPTPPELSLMARPLLSLVVLAACCASAAASPARFADLGLPAQMSKPQLRVLLQAFVDQGFGKSFRH